MSLVERDKKHLWHPLTQHKTYPDPLPIVKAKGAILYGENNEEYIDGIASWYTSMYGHCHPYILEKVQEQMQTLDQIVFSGFTHKPAIELSEKLMALLPDNQEKIFFSDNGSTANEVAIKMALQYYYNQGDKRDTIIAFENGFHGDTFGAMSVSGLSVYNGPFEGLAINVVRIPVPDESNLEDVLRQLKAAIDAHKVAAFIYEPLVQGANAMHMFAAEHLEKLIRICQKNNVLSIADEVMTGFGKTGRNFASDYLNVKPDIISLGKSLTAGFVPMAITSCNEKVYAGFLDDSIGKAFFHAHTYTANPIACAVASAGIDLLNSAEIQDSVQRITAAHQEFDLKIRQHPRVESTRQLGVIYALDLELEMDRYGEKRNEIFKFLMSQGVCLRPLGKTIYILPPFVISAAELNKIYSSITQLLETLTE